MTEQTIVAVFDSRSDADAAVRDLEAASVPANAISRHERNIEATTTTTTAPVREEGFWARLFGSQPDHDTSIYDRSVDGGASVVAVKAADTEVDHISSILERHNPRDLDDRSANHGLTTTSETETMRPTATSATLGAGHTPAATAPENGTMQLAEETLAVGKRAVEGATTRVRRFVVATPVQEQVSLHDETVTLERHPVTDARPVGTADFTDKVVEMTETREEAVVSKSAHVVEEVNLRKDATDRLETVKDTLRHDEVEIEKVPGESAVSRETATPRIPPAPAAKI